MVNFVLCMVVVAAFFIGCGGRDAENKATSTTDTSETSTGMALITAIAPDTETTSLPSVSSNLDSVVVDSGLINFYTDTDTTGASVNVSLVTSNGEAWTVTLGGASFVYYDGLVFQSNGNFIKIGCYGEGCLADICRYRDDCMLDWYVEVTGTWRTDGNNITITYEDKKTVTMPYTISQGILRFDTDGHEYDNEYSKNDGLKIKRWKGERCTKNKYDSSTIIQYQK